MNSPFFSIIIPTFNRAAVICRAIDSVLKQSFTDFELIIIDDGSTDQTLKEISHYAGLHIYSIQNTGVSAARNLGATYARAQWLCFLDSDDEWEVNKLQVLHEYILNNPSYKLVHSNEIWIRSGKRVNLKNKHLKSGGDLFIDSLEFCKISPSATAIKKDVFFELGGFREDFEVCEDYDLWLKFTSLYKVGFIKDSLVIKYGGASDQLSIKFFAMDSWRIQSLDWILMNRALCEDKKNEAIKVILKKAKVLLKGYIKYEHLKKAKELELIINKYSQNPKE